MSSGSYLDAADAFGSVVASLWWKYTDGIVCSPGMAKETNNCQFKQINNLIPGIYKYGYLKDTYN